MFRKIFANVWNWLVVSSEDPYKFSLTLKAGLPTLITGLTIVLGFAHVAIGSADLTAAADSFIQVAQDLIILIGGVTTAYGLARKLVASWRGDHAGVNAQGVGLTVPAA